MMQMRLAPKTLVPAAVVVTGLAAWFAFHLGGPASKSDPKQAALDDLQEKRSEHIRKMAATPPGERPGAMPLASGIGATDRDFDAREFLPLDAASQKHLQDLMRQFSSADTVGKLDLLDQMESLGYGKELLPFLETLLKSESEAEVRERAVQLLSGNTSPDILPVLEVALRDSDESVRLNAVLASSYVSGPEFDRFIRTVFSHPDENTRLAGLDALEGQTVTARVRALDQAMQSGHKELQLPAVGELQFESNHQAIEALIPHLDAPDADVRSEVEFTLRFLLDQDFESAGEAHAWWQANKASFDAELIQR